MYDLLGNNKLTHNNIFVRKIINKAFLLSTDNLYDRKNDQKVS